MRRIVLVLVVVIIAFGLHTPAAQASEMPPNVILILADDLGYGDITSYGARDIPTPNLDRLAKEGRRFVNFHVSQPVCSASRASLLTGSYPPRIGITGALMPNATIGLSAAETTLAELLQARGYATGMAGKWHLGHHPQFLPLQHGFDEYLGIPYSNDMWPPTVRPGGRSPFGPLPLIEGNQIVRAEITPADQRRFTADFSARAVDFVRRHRERPFFFYLAHPMPHVPLFVSERFRGKSQRGLYGDVVMELDAGVGAILDELDRLHLAERTWVIFLSDNGPWISYGSHAGSTGGLREGKHTNWEGGTRVPCLMRWPGRLPAGSTDDTMLMTIDLLPTIARVVGAPPPVLPIDGRDVWGLLSGDAAASHPHEAYAFYGGNGQLEAVTSAEGDWKLVLPHAYITKDGQPTTDDGRAISMVRATVDSPELYRLRDDPGETKNVAAEHPDVVARLLEFADRTRDELGDTQLNRAGRGVRAPGRL